MFQLLKIIWRFSDILLIINSEFREIESISRAIQEREWRISINHLRLIVLVNIIKNLNWIVAERKWNNRSVMQKVWKDQWIVKIKMLR